MAQIAQAMPSNSSLVIKVDAQNNTAADGTAYPVKNGTAWNFGTLCVYRANVNRVAFLFFATDKCIYTGTYNSGVYNWSGWSQMATAEHPQEYDLPLEAGFSGTAKYSKDQFGYVHLRGRVIGVSALNTAFAYLPAGFRPIDDTIRAIGQSGSLARMDISATGRLIIAVSGNIDALASWIDIGCEFQT